MQTATNAIKPNIKTQRLIDFDVAPEIDPLTFKVPKTRAKLMQGEVTPDLAQVFLATQVENRRLKGSTVEAYARNLQRGDFPYNPSAPLMFDTQGRLFDGQHRLQAVIESGHDQQDAVGTPCTCFIKLVGIDDEIFAQRRDGAGCTSLFEVIGRALKKMHIG